MNKVSIICLTYNHEKYIRDTLEGFVSQQTNFEFEAIIHDDASTDGTRKIIKEYSLRYPNIIKPVLQKTNQYSKGDWEFINKLFKDSRSPYIALCEGDDFWIDNKKLQLQVDLMENNPSIALSFHRTKVIFEDNIKESFISPSSKIRIFTLEALLEENFIHTSSVMYRRVSYKNLARKIMPQDLYMHLYHARYGKIGFIDRVMSVYRRQPDGVWWDSQDNMDKIYLRDRMKVVSFYEEVARMFLEDANFISIIQKHVFYLINRFKSIDTEKNESLVKEVCTNYPQVIELYINAAMSNEKSIHQLNDLAHRYQDDIKLLKQGIYDRDVNIKDLEHRLNRRGPVNFARRAIRKILK